MRLMLQVVIISVLMCGCRKDYIYGKGDVVIENRTLPTISGVQVEGPCKVTIVQGPVQKITVKGYSNLVSLFNTKVLAGNLVMKFGNNNYYVGNNNVEVAIEMEALQLANIYGSADMIIGNFTGSRLESNVYGGGAFQANNCQYVNANYAVQGSGVIEAKGLNCQQATTRVSGSGKIETTCSNKLSATILGSGEIHFWGNPVDVQTDISGTGKVVKR